MKFLQNSEYAKWDGNLEWVSVPFVSRYNINGNDWGNPFNVCGRVQYHNKTQIVDSAGDD